ncbi:hypothetical protein CERSUDRAFT_95764 [Gelatoporia subvermispora B]|uniref:Uncharacterized protein n=1 Tax=Ceriporiopsis subvermispora (strain B) TaxID=914234 RepID=M2QWG1_CERS8|nr:hypothetical protein CERSUDRAFT_95764 [Gelatoporia subvermispora B]
MLNTLHIFFICHAIWFYAITNFANPFAIARPTWSVMASVQVTGFSDLTVRGIFCRRVWSLSERNRLITGSIILVSLFCFIMTTIFTIKGAILDNFLSWKGIAWVLYLTLTTGMVADIMLAGVQCILLKRQRDGMIKCVDRFYDTSTHALRHQYGSNDQCLFHLLLGHYNFGYFAFYSVLPTLLLNALLGHLNARKSLRKGLLGGGQMQQTTFALTDTTYDDSSPKPVSIAFLHIIAASSFSQSPSRASMAPMGGPYDQMLEQNEREQIPAKLAGAPPRVSEKQGKLSPPKLVRSCLLAEFRILSLPPESQQVLRPGSSDSIQPRRSSPTAAGTCREGCRPSPAVAFSAEAFYSPESGFHGMIARLD